MTVCLYGDMSYLVVSKRKSHTIIREANNPRLPACLPPSLTPPQVVYPSPPGSSLDFPLCQLSPCLIRV